MLAVIDLHARYNNYIQMLQWLAAAAGLGCGTLGCVPDWVFGTGGTAK